MFPNDEIGVGAKWINEYDNIFYNIKTHVKNIFTIEKIDGNQIEINTDISYRTKPQYTNGFSITGLKKYGTIQTANSSI